MEMLTAEQIRGWDAYTMEHEPIASIDLMERAAQACFDWMEKHGYLQHSFSVWCGKGNNGGDGLALARMLAARECPVTVNILEFGHLGSDDFQVNLGRLHQTELPIRFIQGPEHITTIPPEDIIIDALFGSGLNRPLDGMAAQLVGQINRSGNEVIAIDIPSGLFADRSSRGFPTVKATHTLSFQCYKMAFLAPENAPYTGDVHILDIGLDPTYLINLRTDYELVDPSIIAAIYRPRNLFAHKGTYGHSLIIAGSYGKMGAAVMAGKACLRSGAGLLSCHIPKCGYEILQISLPEAMVFADADELSITEIFADVSSYAVIGIGPGIGQESRTSAMLEDILKRSKKPMVIDADALNIMASDPSLFVHLPPYSILTPHPKEFERLFGPSEDDFARFRLALDQARKHQCIIVLKGHYTLIAMPGGKGHFNPTGNPGMAKGGSGDALTGILTAMLSQGYSPQEAAILGVYLHGLAGDLAAARISQESMLVSDLIDHLGTAFQTIGGIIRN